MKHKWLATVSLAAPFIWIGCMRQVATTSLNPDYASIPVRFVTASEPQWFTTTNASGEVSLVAQADNTDFQNQATRGETQAPAPRAVHVALWGGEFDGNNVTYGVTQMMPGSYTFALIDRDNESSLQGWVSIHSAGSNVLDVLYRWKNDIPQKKESIAYEWDLLGEAAGTDAANLSGFTTQLQALNGLEQRIDAVIAAELRAQETKQQRVADFLREAEVLVIPGEEKFFHPTTEPTFSQDDMTTIRSGNAMTKIVLVADHNDASWKLQRVNDLYEDLRRCKEVFKEEVDRLERRKGLFLLTDHLRQYDMQFVENEVQLQQALDSLASLEADMTNLRDRRTALAFVTGLFSPKGTFRALDQEHAHLKREYAVLSASKKRVIAMLDEVDESSVRRVALERTRQRVMAGLDTLDRQLEELDETRNSLVQMSESTNVLHRQGDTRLLTATFVAEDMPFTVRQAIENEAVMTVRLEADDNIFVPSNTPSVTSVREVPVNTYSSPAFVPDAMTPPVTETTPRPTNKLSMGDDVGYMNQPPKQTTQETDGTDDTWTLPFDWTNPPVKVDTPSDTDRAYRPPAKTTTSKNDMWKNVPDNTRRARDNAPFPSRSTRSVRKFDPSTRKVDRTQKVVPRFVDQPNTDFTLPGPESRIDDWYTEADEPGTFTPDATNDDFHTPSDLPCDDTADDFNLVQPQPNRDDDFERLYSTRLASVYDTDEGYDPYETTQDVVEERNDPCPPLLQLLFPPCWFMKGSNDEPTDMEDTTQLATTEEPYDDDTMWEPETKKRSGCPPLLKLLFPPCWFIKDSDASPEPTQFAALPEPDDDDSRWAPSANANTDCPLWAKLLVPPCAWLSSQRNASTDTYEPAQIASLPETESNWTEPYEDGQGWEPSNKKDSGCTGLAKLLFPPCWFVKDPNPHASDDAYDAVQLTAGTEDAGDESTWEPSAKKNTDCSFLARMLAPPCWWLNDVLPQASASDDASQFVSAPEPYEDGPVWEPNNKKDSGCTGLAKLLFPPCWFVNDPEADYTDPQVQLAVMEDEPAEEESTECPWLVKLLVPPCWFLSE